MRELQASRKYRGYITRQYSRDLLRAAPLHDIGKVGVSDAVLRKPGKLTADEFNQMKLHTQFGAETLRRVEGRLGFQTFLSIAVQVVRHHHERWDGNGYPDGLLGEEIPLSARVMAVADVYDALRSRRPYKEAYSHDTARRIVEEERGKQFDPDVVDAFVVRAREFERIADGTDEELVVSFTVSAGGRSTPLLS